MALCAMPRRNTAAGGARRSGGRPQCRGAQTPRRGENGDYASLRSRAWHQGRRRRVFYARTVVSLPLWAVFAVSFGSPTLAFLGVLVAQLVGRKGAKELETRSKREETMRNLRWAAELAVSDDAAKSELGVAQLIALGDSDLLDEGQQLFVDAALEAVVGDAAEEVDAAGPDVEVVRASEPLPLEEAPPEDVSLETEGESEGAADG